MSEERIKDMIEPIPNWEFTYRYDGSRTCGKSYTQSLLEEKDKEIERLNNIINKAIEYIENEKNKQTSVGVYTKNIHKNLLNILNKGSDK